MSAKLKVKRIPIGKILPNPEQPRTIFDADELRGLAQSIKENGLVNPVVVEAAGERFILIDGERRWRAVRLLKRLTIDAVIRPSTNHRGRGRMVQALVANVQRSQLGPVDEARCYSELYNELGSEEAVGRKVGVSIATVNMRLAILEFPKPVQEAFNRKRLPLTGGVVARLRSLSGEEQIQAVSLAVTRGLSGSAFERWLILKNKRERHVVPAKREKPTIQHEGHFDALALVKDWKTLPKTIIQISRETCQACSLYPEASANICERCPLPDFLVRFQMTYKRTAKT